MNGMQTVDREDWLAQAACRETDIPMFPDQWGIGRLGRSRKSMALAVCRRCPVRLECGLDALEAADAGQILYGVVCGVVFNDVSRPEKDLARLRTVVAKLEES